MLNSYLTNPRAAAPLPLEAIGRSSRTSLGIRPYCADLKTEWDLFIDRAKNGTFLFKRDYMDYHQHRFKDFSLLFYDERDRLRAVLPANLDGQTLYSHQGLTFGGLVTDWRAGASFVLDLFLQLRTFLMERGVAKVVYKVLPHLYGLQPAEEDLYALFRLGAELYRVDLTSTIDLTLPVRFSNGKKTGIHRARRQGVEIVESQDFTGFFAMVEQGLSERHQVRPTHTAAEMEMLHRRFPDRIRLFCAQVHGETVAGVLVYVHPTVVHTQYIAANDVGRSLRAVDCLIDGLVHERFADKRYFDFGISNEQEGLYLNEGLIRQKEEYGARSLAHLFFSWSTDTAGQAKETL